MIKRLEAMKLWLLRRMLRISWTARVTKEEVPRTAGTETTLVKSIRSRQLKLIGHILRQHGVERLAAEESGGDQSERKAELSLWMHCWNMSVMVGQLWIWSDWLKTGRDGIPWLPTSRDRYSSKACIA